MLVVLVVFGISFVVVSVFMPWVFVSSDISFTIGLMSLLLLPLYIPLEFPRKFFWACISLVFSRSIHSPQPFLNVVARFEELTINLPRRRVLGTEGKEILWRVREPEIPPLDFLRTVA